MEPKRFRISEEKYAVVRHFFETTTIHGLPQVWSSDTKCQKLIFFVAFLFCNGLSLYYCYKIVTEYVETPVATRYFVEEVEKMQLPDITVCPFSRFNYDRMRSDYDMSDELMSYAELAFFDFSPTYDFVELQKEIDRHNRSNYRMERKLYTLLKAKNLTFDRLIEAVSTKCSDVILYCLKGARTHYPVNCCENATTVTTTMGKCFRLEGTMQTSGGFNLGMYIMVKLPLNQSVTASNAQLNDGVLVKLTEPGKGLDFDATMVPTGVHALFQMRVTELDFINDPPRFSCNENVSPDYSPILCYERCIFEPMEKKCRCRYVGLQRDDNSTVPSRRGCTPKDMLTCGVPEYQEKLKNNIAFATMCRLRCNGRCNFRQYHSTVSYANFPSRHLVWPLLNVSDNSDEAKQQKFDEVQDRQMVIEVFFEKLEFTKIQHFASMTLYNFVANLGGQVGLWMGGSILSIVHLIVFIFLFLCAGACAKRPTLFLSFSKEPFLDSQNKSPR